METSYEILRPLRALRMTGEGLSQRSQLGIITILLLPVPNYGLGTKNVPPRMTESWPNLTDAAADFRFLLDRGYPRKNALDLVWNRYGLDEIGRRLLHRGVFAPAVAAARRVKLRRLRDLPGHPLALDGHNVLITLECAGRGLPLVAADDGFIRDVGEISGAFKVSPATDRVLERLADYLADHTVGAVDVFYDAPLSPERRVSPAHPGGVRLPGPYGSGRGRAGAGAPALGLHRSHRNQRHGLDRRTRHRGGPGRGDH